MVGTASSGEITPRIAGFTHRYNAQSRVQDIRGTGTTSDPWHFPVERVTSKACNEVGGNLITQFSQPVESVTITYGSNASAYARKYGLCGPQGAGIGRLCMCV